MDQDNAVAQTKEKMDQNILESIEQKIDRYAQTKQKTDKDICKAQNQHKINEILRINNKSSRIFRKAMNQNVAECLESIEINRNT